MTIRTNYLQMRLHETINWHLPILKQYSEGCSHITEMGVRNLNSTWAFLIANPNKLVSVDWDKPPFEVNKELLLEAYSLAAEAGIEFEFISGDTTKIELQEDTDLLFIDTWHTYHQLLLELLLHSGKAKKYILAHDTNDNFFPGMSFAIEDFITLNPYWEIREVFSQGTGMVVLERTRYGDVDWGNFQYAELLKEIELQQSLYYSEIDEVKQISISQSWHEYVQSQVELFSARVTV